tara:strand:- start:13770 stop:16250 length:2481 start_codon:yes stop_codon:yes gene_type:complete
MAIEKLNPEQDGVEGMPAEGEVEVTIENPDAVSIETEDGGVIVDFDPQEELQNAYAGFYENLAEYIDEDILNGIGSDLVAAFNSDKDSRKEWEESYTKGLDQLGLKIEERTEPWNGACGVFHPMLSEAVVRFQSQAISEIFPAKGPVRTQVVGKMTDDKEKQAGRVQDYLNYLLTYEMKEYRTETEKLLFSLPLAGSAFRKIYFDPNLQRPCGHFVPAEDMVVNYGAADLETSERATHVMKKSNNDLLKMQVSGFYRKVKVPDSSNRTTDVTEKYDEITGEQDTHAYDNRHTLLEMQVNLDLPGFEDMIDGEQSGIALPYIVTLDFPSGIVLSIRRNYYEDDPKKEKRNHFVHYQYLPGIGFYGFGLVHLIGGLSKSATSILRQLVDAGTLSNLPGGLKARGLRIKGDDTPIMPGEFRDVDVPGGAIKDNITFLPYKEPSGTLYQLLQNIVEEGRRFASISDMKISDMNNQAPVGTTLALLERNMKVMSAVQARLHASMRREFDLLVDIVRDFTNPEYPYETGEEEQIKKSDFDKRIDVLPVSDPNAATMSQRIMQYQAAMQLSQTAPQMYNLPELHRQMLDVLGIKDTDEIVPLQDDIKPVDPVSAVQNILSGKPVKAFQYQDHDAHIQTVMSAQQNPEILELLQQSPNAGAIQAAGMGYVTDHLQLKYRKQIEDELGIELPPMGEPLPAELEKRLSVLVAEASDILTNKAQRQQQAEQIQEQLQDPIIQQKQEELRIKAKKHDDDMQIAKTKLTIDVAKAAEKEMTERMRIKSQEGMAGASLGQKIASDLLDAEQSKSKQAREDYMKGVDLGVKIAEDSIKDGK